MRAPPSKCCPMVFALAFVFCGKAFPAQENREGRPVVAIEFEPADQPLPGPEMLTLVSPLRSGGLYRAADVRTAIQNLFSTGRFSDIQVDASPASAGVTVRFLTTKTYFLGRVSAKGSPDPPNSGQLATATKLGLGTRFSAPDLGQATDNIIERLRANGLYRATVSHRQEPEPAIEQMNIDFTIDPGKRAAFGNVVVEGEPGKPVADIIRMTRWRRFLVGSWRPMTEKRLQSGIDNVRSYYQKHDQLLAKVTLSKLDYDEQTNTVTPSLRIDAGPIVKVRAEGAKLSKGKLRALLPIYQERSVDRSLLVEGRRNLVEYFQAQGYFDVAVDFEETPQEKGVETIQYVIDKDVRHTMANLKIEGNKYFDSETIRERLYIQPSSFVRYRHGRYSERYLSKDIQAIEELYRSNGFRDVTVTSKLSENYRGRKNDIAVELHIAEGAQWFVSKLDLEGESAEEKEHLLSILHSTAGQTYSEYNVATDRDAVLSYYYNNGYPQAQFDWSQADSEEHRVALRFLVTPGPRRFVRDVIVRGLERTNPDLVQNRITLHGGDPLSQIEIAETQRRMYDLGIFAKVQTAIQNPDGVEDGKYVLYQVEEARLYSVNFGFGAEIARIGGGVTTFDSPAGSGAFSPRVSFGVSRLNLMGLGQTLSLQTRVSSLQQRALVSYYIPQFKGLDNWNLTLTTLFDDSHDVRTFAARRLEESIQLGQRVSRATTFQYRFTYRDVFVDPLSVKITPDLIPLLSQSVRDGVLGGSFIQDRRDDPTDARRGIYNTVDLGLSLKAFGSESEFTRINARNATYHRLTRDLTFARSTSFGWMQRLGGLAAIPLPEVFFSGGASSMRAFPDNQAGPRDTTTGFPLGGKALLMNSLELRFPLVGENVGGVLFHDAGNVYSSVSDISFRFRQRNLQDFNYMVQGIGFGIRYRTPIGPIRVDLSLSPNSPRFNGFTGSRDQLLLCAPPGQKVTCTPVAQHISIFQFHFSLGQAF